MKLRFAAEAGDEAAEDEMVDEGQSGAESTVVGEADGDAAWAAGVEV